MTTKCTCISSTVLQQCDNFARNVTYRNRSVIWTFWINRKL